MRGKIFIVIAVWIAIVSGSFFWNFVEAVKARDEIAFQTARSFFDQIVIARTWNARHGGVYVPVTEDTQPNPYLAVPGRDIIISQDLTLTKINPSYMTRQMSEIAAKQKGMKFHMTSLLPVQPENKPTPQEEKALEAFEKGVKEVGQFSGTGDEAVFFYMAPLVTEKTCLLCHAVQGYKEGDIRGGISVTLPFRQKIPLITLVAGHLAIGLAGIVGILIFGAKLETYYEMLQRQSDIDVLTGIPNRRSFSGIILREFRRARREHVPLSLIMCDIDRFKDYNDTYGHAAGDECLMKVAKAMENTLNRAGDFCARYGGEEFVIILPNMHSNGALNIAEKIRKNVEALGIVHERSSPLKIVTLSLGVATMDKEGMIMSVEDLIRRADEALYKVKESGRNRSEAFQEMS
jgi:diguanylate cyclase (GGDEF)-like protein